MLFRSILGGQLIYSPNSRQIPALPWNGATRAELTTIFNFKSSSLKDFTTPLWWTDERGWLSFTPLYPDLLTFPFDTLSSVPYRLPHNDDGYFLGQDIVYEWKYLEYFLYQSTSVIQQTIVNTSLRPYSPGSYHYSKTYAKAGLARARIMKARDWFTVWAADRKSTRLNSSHSGESRMPSSA